MHASSGLPPDDKSSYQYYDDTHYSLAYYNIGEPFLYSPCIHENKIRLIEHILDVTVRP